MAQAVDRTRVAEVLAVRGYALDRQLGAGAFGLVFAARHLDLDRNVAVKVLSTAGSVGTSAELRGEARLLARLDHPHIVKVHDYVEHDELSLVVMELLAGGTLTQRRRRTGLSVEAACAVVLAAGDALGRAHDVGVLHRDVKPDNMIFSGDGMLKVTDFGIAKIFVGTAATASAVIGTPLYMAPEQVEAGRLGPPTDVYSLATVCYELLAGRPPFDPSLPMMSLFRHVLEVVPPPPAGVPRPVADVVLRGLAKDPADRYPTARSFALDLAGAATGVLGSGWTGRAGVLLHISDDVREATTSPGSGPRPDPDPGPGLKPDSDPDSNSYTSSNYPTTRAAAEFAPTRYSDQPPAAPRRAVPAAEAGSQDWFPRYQRRRKIALALVAAGLVSGLGPSFVGASLASSVFAYISIICFMSFLVVVANLNLRLALGILVGAVPIIFVLGKFLFGFGVFWMFPVWILSGIALLVWTSRQPRT